MLLILKFFLYLRHLPLVRLLILPQTYYFEIVVLFFPSYFFLLLANKLKNNSLQHITKALLIIAVAASFSCLFFIDFIATIHLSHQHHLLKQFFSIFAFLFFLGVKVKNYS